ncbi:MAG TPA: arginine--tRNA ligase [Elusimicrobiota bacterium]|jgi:arginyl-tRNA synthetase|nr:arginine--tRNA ligase [Elusimicrobiota bacterium]
MILERLRADAARVLNDWAKAQGGEAPPVVMSPAPEHVAADVCIPWPLAAAKVLKRKPLEIAAQAAAELAELPGVAKAEPAPPGFVNITLDLMALGANLEHALAPGERGHGYDPEARRDILIEFVSANPTGPVHLASSRAATLGDSLTRILRRRGHKVWAEYYVNDVGRQVKMLGLSVKARWDQAHGKDVPLPEDGYQGEYIKDVAAAAPPEAAGWSPEDFSRFSIERMLGEHKRDMEAFGVRFDRWFRESELHAAKALDKALAKLRSLGKVYDKDGAVWLGSTGEGSEDDKDRVLVRKDGLPTYFLADIAYHLDKLSRGHKELIDILGADHHGYVPRMKAAIAALGYPPGTLHAIVHQLVHLFRGNVQVKMSKRAGEFITLNELVEEAGLDACRFFFALRTANAHMNFDLELARKQSSENPVYYVQYVHARICSIFREAATRNVLPAGTPLARGAALLALKEPSERALLLKIAGFPEVLRVCERELSPHPLANYLMELAGLYHPFYEKCRVLDPAAKELSAARLTLCDGVRTVIADGLGLLGVSAPEQM